MTVQEQSAVKSISRYWVPIISVIISVIASLTLASYNYGQLRYKVDSICEKLGAIEMKLQKVQDHEVKIARIEEQIRNLILTRKGGNNDQR